MSVMTKEAYEKIEKQLEQLNIERIAVTKRKHEAASHGDLKENAEYHSAKDQFNFITSRMNELSEQLTLAKIVSKQNDGKVGMGSELKLLNVATDDEERMVIVSPSEIGDDDSVSINSPLAQALLGKVVGEEVAVKVPRGTLTYKILEIK